MRRRGCVRAWGRVCACVGEDVRVRGEDVRVHGEGVRR